MYRTCRRCGRMEATPTASGRGFNMVDFRKMLEAHRERTPEQREAFMARLRKEWVVDMARGKQNKGKAGVREAGLPAGYAPRSGSFPSQWEPSVGDTLTGKISD